MNSWIHVLVILSLYQNEGGIISIENQVQALANHTARASNDSSHAIKLSSGETQQPHKIVIQNNMVLDISTAEQWGHAFQLKLC